MEVSEGLTGRWLLPNDALVTIERAIREWLQTPSWIRIGNDQKVLEALVAMRGCAGRANPEQEFGFAWSDD
jgi:hypothetical protein